MSEPEVAEEQQLRSEVFEPIAELRPDPEAICSQTERNRLLVSELERLKRAPRAALLCDPEDPLYVREWIPRERAEGARTDCH
jgi:hypothetical protein